MDIGRIIKDFLKTGFVKTLLILWLASFLGNVFSYVDENSQLGGITWVLIVGIALIIDAIKKK